MNVLFASKCYGGDYYHFLKDAFNKKWQSCNYPFDTKWLLINNDVPSDAYCQLKAEQIIDVSKYEDIVLKYFKLKKKNFNGGYIYSIAELIAIYLAQRFNYLCWLQGDVLMNKKEDWITPAIKILEDNPNISVVAPLSELNTYHNDKGLDHFFSDHAYLIRVSEFRKKIYNYKKPELNEYPSHGGNSFERMIGRYLHNTNKYRKILNEFYTLHPAY